MKKISLRSSGVKDNMIECLAIAIVAFIVYTIIWPVILSVHDDIFSYIVAQKGDIIEFIIKYAKDQGRFGFFISGPISYFPFIFNNFIVYRLISYISICFSVISLAILIKNNINNNVALLSILWFFTFAQLDGQHNLLVSYVFSHQISIGLVLISIERLTSFYKDKKKRNLIFSALLLFLSTFLYESFILFSIFLFLISLLNYKEFNFPTIKKIIIDLRYHIMLMLLYIILFCIWRVIYPGNYDGAQFQFGNIKDSLKVMVTYSLARLPLVSTVHNYHNYKYSMLEPIFIIKGFLASIVSVFILKKADILNRKICVYCFILCILGVFLPTIVHAFTPKYIDWVKNGSYAYLPSFYSYFFITAFISILITLIYQKLEGLRLQRVYIIFILLIVFFSSIFTDINNKLEADNYQVQLKRYKAFDNAVSSEYFKSIEDGAMIYIPEYNGIHNYMPYMDYYASIYSKKTHIFTNRIEDLTFENPTYGFHYDPISGNMLIGKIKNNMLVDDILIVSNKAITNQTAVIYQNNSNIISVDGIESSFYDKTAIIPINSSKTYVEMHGRDLDLYNSCVINEKLQYKPIQTIVLGEGFYPREIWGNDIAYWCSNVGKFILYNKFDEAKYAIVSAKIASADDKQSHILYLNGEDLDNKYTITSSQQELSFKLLLQPGKNEFTFSCDSPPLEDGSRRLVFYVINLNMTFGED